MNSIRRAAILTCGNELLLGKISNANGTVFARLLSKMGLEIVEITTVADDRLALKLTLQRLLQRADLVLLTGGLGSTEDDLSMEVAAAVAGFPLRLNEEVLAHLKHYYAAKKRKMPSRSRRQALLPHGEGSLLIPNPNGSAYGAMMRFFCDGDVKHLALLPGPPIENRAMFTRFVQPYLEKYSASGKRIYQTVRTCGMGEGDIAASLNDLLCGAVNPYIATFCSPDEVVIEFIQDLTRPALALDKTVLAPGKAVLQQYVEEVVQRLGDIVYEIGERSLVETLRDQLFLQKKTLAVAESCTGGLLSQKLVSVPGISAVYRGGFITYQNEVKKEVLAVPALLVEKEGVVSECCAKAMARSAKEKMNADYSLSITGFAGPKVNPEDEVGLVYISCAHPSGVHCRRYYFGGSRENIREWAAKSALTLLHQCLKENANHS